MVSMPSKLHGKTIFNANTYSTLFAKEKQFTTAWVVKLSMASFPTVRAVNPNKRTSNLQP